MLASLSPKIIQDLILENYAEYISLFGEFQSRFLADLNRRYQGLSNGHLVLYFEKKSHQGILRRKDYDLNFDLGFDKFWQNHSEIIIEPTTITTISKDTQLPKETARRKISNLVKHKILNKKLKHIGWLPNEHYKKSYNEFVGEEIAQVSKLIKYVTKKTNFNIFQNNIENEFKNKFSFYWFHYLSTQLKYMSLWKKQFDDLEVLLIVLQISTVLAGKAKLDKVSHASLYKNPKTVRAMFDYNKTSLSATSISDVTGISRATCVRKLNTMVESKMLTQDDITRRYFLRPEAFSYDQASKEVTLEVVKIFSEFYFIFTRALTSKASN